MIVELKNMYNYFLMNRKLQYMVQSFRRKKIISRICKNQNAIAPTRILNWFQFNFQNGKVVLLHGHVVVQLVQRQLDWVSENFLSRKDKKFVGFEKKYK